MIVVSEGAAYPDGKFLAEAGTRDAFGHAQLGGVAPVVANMVREAHGYKYHWAVADYLQRAARHIASKVDVEQAYAVGKAAVEFALRGVNAVMPTIVRKSAQPYRWEIGHVPLERRGQRGEEGAARLHHAPTASASRAACRRYLEPLIAGEAYPPYRERPAGLRAHQGRAGAPQAQDRLQALSAPPALQRARVILRSRAEPIGAHARRSAPGRRVIVRDLFWGRFA